MADTVRRLRNISADQRKLLAKRLREFPNQAEPIAIVGMSCRFAGVSNLEEYWHLISQGNCAIREIPETRWDIQTLYDASGEQPGKMSVRWAGLVDAIDQFDPQFFGITPREAARMDPQQRLLLEVSWEAFEMAGFPLHKLSGSEAGVFVGIGGNDYSKVPAQFEDYFDHLDAHMGTGNALSMAANRLSYFYDFRGPSMAIDTACSSSTMAVHQAVQSLRRGECNLAIAGGVNAIITPETTIAFSKAKMLSPDGRCRPFDAKANGYVRGEGCGVLVLKRLLDAVDDGDNIVAIIRGSATNQDGRTSGITAPNGLSQQAVIQAALAEAQVSPDQVNYIEAHGTGTPLGDPIEVDALNQLFRSNADSNSLCYIGSVKANIGHTETAAGVAGIIKVALMMQNGVIPPQALYEKLNPHISLRGSRISIPQQTIAWSDTASSRIAGVSSFGFGGTNTHIVLEGVESEIKSPSTKDRSSHLLTLSAQSRTALYDSAARLSNYVSLHSEANVADVAFSLNSGRTHFNQRLVIQTSDRQQLLDQLNATADGKTVVGVEQDTIKSPLLKTAFLFSGQGSQYSNMGKVLFETHPLVRGILEQCDELLRDELDYPLLSVLFSADGELDQIKQNGASSNQLNSELINSTLYTQPALFAVEYAVAKLWQSWGVQADIVMGHSVGEYAAACIAGIMSWEEGLRLVSKRARLAQQISNSGTMAVLFASQQIVSAALKSYADQVSIAAINGPSNIVISGHSDAVLQLIDQFQEQGIKTQQLRISTAFHSSMMESILDEFEQAAAQINFKPAQIPMISNLSGRLLDQPFNAKYLRDHVRQPVRFYEGITALAEQNIDVMLETGPSTALLTMGQQCVNPSNALWLPSLRQGKCEWTTLCRSLGKFYTRGGIIDWDAFDSYWPRNKVSLPLYPFQRQRYWFETGKSRKVNNEIKQSANQQQQQAQLYQIKWQACDTLHPSKTIKPGIWLIFTDQDHVGNEFAQWFSKQKMQAVLIHYSGSYSCKDKLNGIYTRFTIDIANKNHYTKLIKEFKQTKQGISGVIHLWNLDNYEPGNKKEFDLELVKQRSIGSVFILIQQMIMASLSSLSTFMVVTSGAQKITVKQKSLACFQSAVWGLGRVAVNEHPELGLRLIDLDPEDDVKTKFTQLKNELQQISQESQIAYRNGRRYAARLTKAAISENIQSVFVNGEQPGSYLITGGLGALGIRLAFWLYKQGAKYIVLLSRRNPSDTDTSVINELQQQGAQVALIQADVSNEQSLKKALKSIPSGFPQLKGVVHAAGVIDDALLKDLSDMQWNKPLSAKIAGAWNLHCVMQNLKLDFFILYSSIASVLGSPGQANYATGNAFLDGLANYRNSLGLPGLSVNWGPWAESGMAIDEKKARQIESRGISLLSPKAALAQLQYLVQSNTTQACVMDIQWKRFLHLLGGRIPPLLQEMVGKSDIQPKAGSNADNDFHNLILSSEVKQRHSLLSDYIAEQLAIVMEMTATTIDRHQLLNEFGLDSLLMLELKTKLEQQLQCALPMSVFIDNPTIDRLADYASNAINASEHRVAVNHNQHTVSDSVLMTLQAKGDKPSLYCFHPLSGNVDCYVAQALSMSQQRPLVGVRAQPDNGSVINYQNLKELIEHYVVAIREQQNSGAYYLAGWSAGGILAYETARQLINEGHRVAYLGMFDTPLPSIYNQVELDNEELFIDEFIKFAHLYIGVDTGIAQTVSATSTVEQKLELILKAGRDKQVFSDKTNMQDILRLIEASRGYAKLIKNYKIENINIPVHLYKPESDGMLEQMGKCDLSYDLGWGDILGNKLKIETVKGDHVSMMSNPHVRSLASAIEKHLLVSSCNCEGGEHTSECLNAELNMFDKTGYQHEPV